MEAECTSAWPGQLYASVVSCQRSGGGNSQEIITDVYKGIASMSADSMRGPTTPRLLG